MNKIINCILLVDDNESDNYFSTRALRKRDNINLIRVARDGVEALEYLENKGNFSDPEENPRPNIIFLDINMPRMNGFEFLEEYMKLETIQHAETLITMLSTSRNPEDISKAEAFDTIADFCTKPLNNETIDRAFNSYFDKVGY